MITETNKKNKKKKKDKEEAPQELPNLQMSPPGMPQPGSLLRENGITMVIDKFDQEKIMPVVAQIMEYNLMDEDDRPEHITMIINSPGGSVHSALHLTDMMFMSEIPIRTMGHGLIASCGIITLMAGYPGERYISSTASAMSHQYSWGSMGKEHELYAKVKEFEMASTRLIKHYKHCTKKSESYIRKNLLNSSDAWLTPEECLRSGIVDKVLNPYDDTVTDLKELRKADKEAKKEKA